jgi:hypothetical protein
MRAPFRAGIGAAALALALSSAPAARSPQAPSLPALLAEMGAYLAEYERRLPAVVAEEHYLQTDGTNARFRRRLVSDLAAVAMPGIGWVAFRDVYAVDGQPVRDRDERISALFLEPKTDPVAQARAIADAGARYNLNVGPIAVNRTINNPMIALRFLRGDNQPRSRFTIEGTREEDGRPVVVIRFLETAVPRLIRSVDNAEAEGEAWIDRETGRVVRTQLDFASTDTAQRTRVSSTIRVRFAPVERIGLWLPIEMDERYQISYRGSYRQITGRAQYSNFRQFQVDVQTIIK